MIQRIQTVYLILGACALGGLFFIDPIWGGPAAESQSWFTPVAMILAALAALIAVGAVFLYANRPRQRTVIVMAQVVTLLLLIALYGGLFLAGALTVRTASGVDLGMVIGLILPLVAYFFFLLARRGVTKDIELVRSMDRLR